MSLCIKPLIMQYMISSLIYASIVFMGFSAIMNPISGMSFFLTLTKEFEEDKSKIIAFKSVLTAFVIVTVFAIAGNFFLNLFGVSFTALRLAGGVLVAMIGYEMLHGRPSQVNEPTQETLDETIEEEGSIAITPLGIPLLAGPGVIITAMNFSAGSINNLLITVLSFGLLCVITYYTFIFGKNIKEIMGSSALKVLTKMMGLVLIVIGTQMILDGTYSAVQEMPSGKYFRY